MNIIQSNEESNIAEPRKTSIILADDHPVVREGLHTILGTVSDIQGGG